MKGNMPMSIEKPIERRLEQFARWGDRATWRNLAVAAGLDPGSRKAYNQIVKVVNDIDHRRHEQGQCLLSPLIHSTRSRRPRKGFVKLFTELGLLPDILSAAEVFEEQLSRTWADYAADPQRDEAIAA